MDLKLVIREMLKKGVSESEIIDNLKELGVQDADKVLADAMKDYKPETLKQVEPPKLVQQPAPAAQKPVQPVPASQMQRPVQEQQAQPEKKSGFQLFGSSLFGGSSKQEQPAPQQPQPVKQQQAQSAPQTKQQQQQAAPQQVKPVQQATSLFGAPQQKPAPAQQPKLQAPVAKPVQKPAVVKEQEEDEMDALVPKQAVPKQQVQKQVEEPEMESITEKPLPKPRAIREALDEKPALREFKAIPSEETGGAHITKIDDYGVEKELSVSDVVQKAEVPPALMRKVAASSADELEEKLDETVALLKALQDINKRILETDRQVLLRLQK